MSSAGASGGEMAGAMVAVVGGGLAGLASALACADGGARVTLFEARPRLFARIAGERGIQ